MTIKPINDNIVLEIEKEEKMTKTNSGILIMNHETGKSNQYGTVVAVGQGRILNDGTKIEPSVKVGDSVIYDSFAGTHINTDDKRYVIIKENNILGIL